MTDSALFRLDKLVVDQQLAENRTAAEYLIKTYGVLVNGKLVNKPGKKFSVSVQIETVIQKETAVSVRAVILKKALSAFSLSVKNKIALDIGAGKGGFTQVLLDSEAQHIYAVEKQDNQLTKHLREEISITNLPNKQARELTPALIKDKIEVCTVDVDDMSLDSVLPFIHPFLKPDAAVVVVVKPQFELDKKEVQKGLVKNTKLLPTVVQNVKKQAALSNLVFVNSIESPILGNHGNREFVLYFKKS